MTSLASHCRRGMTLVELLVVVFILGLLAVTVIPNLSNTSDERKVRDAASAVSSFIAGGQSRALGSRSGGGVWFDVLPTSIASGASSIYAVIDLADADVASPYSGDATNSTIVFPDPPSGTGSTDVTFVGGCNPPWTTGLIRFGGAPSLFNFAWGSASTGTVSMRTNANQTVDNTFWPRPGIGVPYEIIGPPTRSPASSLTLPDGVAIDLMHSTIGAQSLQTVFPAGTVSFQILCDATGRPRHLAWSSGSLSDQVPLNDPIYLFVALIESIQNSSRIDFAPVDGYWVSIDPRGGVPKVAEVDPTGTNIETQQSYIRKGAVQYAR